MAGRLSSVGRSSLASLRALPTDLVAGRVASPVLCVQRSHQNLAKCGVNCYSTRGYPVTREEEEEDSNNVNSEQVSKDSTHSYEEPSHNNQATDFHEKRKVNEQSFLGISLEAFPDDVTKVLMAPLDQNEVEIKPDGLIYLPEIKYRRILHRSFGPGGWALMPRGDPCHFKGDGGEMSAQLITREYAMFCLGRFVAQSTGEHTFYRANLNYGRALESSKSNALMRCCKDLGIASELWDPTYISDWKVKHSLEVWCENVRTKEKKKLWRKKTTRDSFPYPWKESKSHA